MRLLNSRDAVRPRPPNQKGRGGRDLWRCRSAVAAPAVGVVVVEVAGVAGTAVGPRAGVVEVHPDGLQSAAIDVAAAPLVLSLDVTDFIVVPFRGVNTGVVCG